MTDKKLTLGQAIDQIIDALDALEQNARQTAIDAACSHLGIQPVVGSPSTLKQPPSGSSKLSKPSHTTSQPMRGKKTELVDIRTFKEQKQPKSAKQMACVAAYYLKELAADGEKKETLTTQDLEKYFKQAGFKLPKAINQVLLNAKASGYFESTGKGEYKLNAVGYNLVAHSLPKSERE